MRGVTQRSFSLCTTGFTSFGALRTCTRTLALCRSFARALDSRPQLAQLVAVLHVAVVRGQIAVCEGQCQEVQCRERSRSGVQVSDWIGSVSICRVHTNMYKYTYARETCTTCMTFKHGHTHVNFTECLSVYRTPQHSAALHSKVER